MSDMDTAHTWLNSCPMSDSELKNIVLKLDLIGTWTGILARNGLTA